MAERGTLPLLGPVIVLYLAVELVETVELDGTGVVLTTAGVLASLLPMRLLRRGEPYGTRRLSALSVALAVALVALAQPEVRSPFIELAGVLALPPVGSLTLDLALDTPDRPPGLVVTRALRGFGHALAFVATWLGAMAVLPPFELFGELILAPPSCADVAPVVVVGQLAIALAIRMARRRLGSSPEALASNGLALLGVGVATLAGLVVLVLVALGADRPGAPLVRSLVCGGGAALVLGHLAMCDARRPTHAAPVARRVVAAGVTIFGLGATVGAFADRIPDDRFAVGVLSAALLASGGLAFLAIRALIEFLGAPDSGRLLAAIEAAHAGLAGARTIEEIGAAVLGPLRRAARTPGARPVLQTLDPPRQISIDAAGLPRVEMRELPPTIRARLFERPGEIVVLAPLRAQVVRRPELRSLVDALEAMDALCVVPIAAGGELEGALVVARGKRSVPLELEEIAALEGLASRLVGPLAMGQAEARAQERARKAMFDSGRLEEKVETLADELERLRSETRTLKAGQAAGRLDAPPIAYSPAMRALIARIHEVAPTFAPVQIVAEGGSGVDQIGYLIHAASPAREGPFVVADCKAIRPERAAAALFGDEGENGHHPGWIRLASGGTLLLVDIPALSLDAQTALAEAIATRVARREGVRSGYPVEMRLVAHTRVDLSALAQLGAFDAELARRLAPLRLDVPPLRERREDLPSLVLLALDRACRALGREILGIDDSALERLLSYDWPGNLPELEWVIDRAVLRAEPPRVREHDLPPLPVASAPDPLALLEGSWAEIERRVLRAALDRAKGNKSEAARLLGLKRTTFLDKLRRAGFEVRESRPPNGSSSCH